jgi:hypothetical protein
MMHDDPAFKLGRALDQRRIVMRQAVGVVALVAAFVIWRVAPLHQPEPLTSLIFAVGGVAFAVLLILLLVRAEEQQWWADRLIVNSRGTLAGTTPISCAVARRVTRLESARVRRRLAAALVWRLRLAEGTARPSIGYVRASVVPPLSRQERSALLADRGLVLHIAARVADDVADPVALVLLVEWVTAPPPINDAQAAAAAGQLHRRLVRVAELLDASH